MCGKTICGLVMGLAILAGCNDLGTGWHGKYKPKADPYEAITTGMTEQALVKLMGRPVKATRIEGEGGSNGATVLQLRWMTHNHIITVFVVDGLVAGKSRV